MRMWKAQTIVAVTVKVMQIYECELEIDWYTLHAIKNNSTAIYTR